MAQVRYRFDRETLVRIAKGAGYALSSPIVLEIAGLVKHSDLPLWVKLVVWGVPTGFNAIKEFIKGEKNETGKEIKEKQKE